MGNFFKSGDSMIDLDQVAAVNDPNEKHVMKITLASGGHVSIKFKGKTQAKTAHQALVTALSGATRRKAISM